MLTNGDFVWTSTMSGAVRVLDSAKFDIADKDSSLPLKLSVSRSGYEIDDRYADSIGTRTVYNAATGDYLMYVNDNTIAELDSEGNKKSTFKTAYPVFAMYNYGDSVLVIEKDTDENFYVENLKWAYPTKITLSKTSATIKVGESLSLKATSDSVLDISFTWSSSNNSVASVTKDGKVVTPKSNSILPSITRRSLMVVAKDILGLEAEEREVYFDEVKDFAECGLCGTAAVISPVGKINDHGKEICFPSGMEKMGPVIQKLYDTLTGIQMGRIEGPEGWLKVIE